MSHGGGQAPSDAQGADDAARILQLEERIRLLSETTRAFAEATSDHDQLVCTVAHRVAETIGDFCGLLLLSEDGQVLLPVAAHARDAELLRRIERRYAAAPLRPSEQAAARRVLETGDALLIPRVALDRGSEPASPERLQDSGGTEHHSLLVVAVRAQRRSIGILVLRRFSPDLPPFDALDRDLAQTLADHAGLAITNARLLRRAQSNFTARARAETRFARLSDAGIIGIVVGQQDGTILEINGVLLAMLGYSREEILSGAMTWRDLTPPDWVASDARAREQIRSTGLAELREKEYFRKDGGRVPVLMGTAKLEDGNGETISFVLDLTARKLAERARSQLAAIVDSSTDAILAKSTTGTIESWNAGAERLFGYTAAEVVGEPSTMLLPAERRAEEHALLESIASGLPVSPFETERIRKDGTRLDVSLAVSPIYDPHGVIVGVSTIARDITESKRAERLIRDSLAEKVVLLKEIHHRVKNNLQVVSSILRLQSHHVTDPAACAAFEASQGRVRSIALLHEKLYQSRDLGSVDMAAYASSLSTLLVRAHGESVGAVRIEVEGQGVFLPVDLAAPCGLILNELITNAFKHAFTAQVEGARVRILVDQHGIDIAIVVADNGRGLPPDFDGAQSKSLGMFLARTLAEQLGGTLEMATDRGTRCTLRFSAATEVN